METPLNRFGRRDLERTAIVVAAFLGGIASLIFAPHIFDGITLFGGPAPQYSHPMLLQVFLYPGVTLVSPILMMSAKGGPDFGMSVEALIFVGNVIGYAILAYLVILIGRFVSAGK